MGANSKFLGEDGIGNLAEIIIPQENKTQPQQQEPPRSESDSQQRNTTGNQRPQDFQHIPSEAATTMDAPQPCFNQQNTVNKELSGNYVTLNKEMTKKKGHCLSHSVEVPHTSEKMLKRPHIKLWPTLVISLVALVSGSSVFYMGSVLPQLTQQNSDDIFLTSQEISIFGSVYHLGGVMGSCLCWPLQTLMGQRILINLAICLNAAAWLAINLTTSVWLLFLSRTVQGMSMYCLFPLFLTFTVETTHKSYRGMLTGMQYLFFSCGCLMPTITVMAHLSWRQTALVGCITGLVPIVGTLLLLDSPRWLMSRGRDTDAKKALIFFLGDSDETESEYKQIAAQVVREGQGGIRHQTSMMFRSPTRRTIGLLFAISISACFGGTTLVVTYMVPLLQMTNSSVDPYLMSNVCILLKILGCALVTCLSDRLGRKPFATIGFTNICVCYGLISLYFFLQRFGLSGISWFPTVTIAIIMFSEGLAFAGYQIMEGELLPLSCRTIGVLFLGCSKGISSIIGIYTYQMILDALGKEITFLLYCAVAAVVPCIITFSLQETNGASLEEITTNTVYADNTLKKDQETPNV